MRVPFLVEVDGWDRDERLKARVGVLASFAYGALILTACTVGWAVTSDWRSSVLPAALGATALIVNPWLVRLTGRARVAGTLLVLELLTSIVSSAFTSGGPTATGPEPTTLPWLMVVPMLAATLVGRWFAWVAAALCAAQAVTMYALAQAGFAFPDRLPGVQLSSLWSVVMAIGFVLAVTLINARMLRQANADRDGLAVELLAAQKLEAVGRLSGGVAHEINTPVQFVSDSVHFAREGVDALIQLRAQLRALVPPERAAEADAAIEAADCAYLEVELPLALERSREGLERVASIVRALRAFARADVGEKVPVDLNAAIASTLVVSKGEYKLVADVETALDPALPPVQCHAGQINQVVLNLICNAAHAIGDTVKGTEGRGTIAVKTSREGDSAVIAITDTGGGIPEAVRPRIFEPYFTTKEVGRGSGQGLSLCRTYVRGHHGQLTFETKVGVGTTFFVRLPLAA